MHVRDLRAFGWLELAQKHLAECAVFATEFDFEETDHEALDKTLTLPEGQNLESLLGNRAWKNLDHYAQKHLRKTADALRHQHPMTISTLISMASLAEESAHSLDETLWLHARALGKRTTGMESFADQLETLQRIPLEQHLKGLTFLLKNRARQKKRLHKMMERYAAGEIQALYRMAKKESKGLRKILLYHRNILMTKRFEEIAQARPLFCAVGAGHLAGGKGMLRLLKKSGFRIAPVLQ